MMYKCEICQWIYDDDAEDVPFVNLPENYICPACGAGKEMFTLVEE